MNIIKFLIIASQSNSSKPSPCQGRPAGSTLKVGVKEGAVSITKIPSQETWQSFSLDYDTVSPKQKTMKNLILGSNPKSQAVKNVVDHYDHYLWLKKEFKECRFKELGYWMELGAIFIVSVLIFQWLGTQRLTTVIIAVIAVLAFIWYEYPKSPSLPCCRTDPDFWATLRN